MREASQVGGKRTSFCLILILHFEDLSEQQLADMRKNMLDSSVLASGEAVKVPGSLRKGVEVRVFEERSDKLRRRVLI